MMMFSALPRRTMRRSSVIGSLPIVTLGLLLVTFAILRAPWPPDPQSVYGTTESYFDRLRGKEVPPPYVDVAAAEKNTAWYARRVADGLVLVLLLAGYASTGFALWSDNRRMLAVLIVIGACGTGYGGMVGLFTGPILTIGGFALVFFGAGLHWLSQTQNGA
jgi:hypothetical protein